MYWIVFYRFYSTTLKEWLYTAQNITDSDVESIKATLNDGNREILHIDGPLPSHQLACQLADHIREMGNLEYESAIKKEVV